MKRSLEEKVMEYVQEQPGKMAVLSRTEQVSYGELGKKIMRIQSALYSKGIRSQSKVVLQAVSSSDYIAAYVAVHLLNAVVVPVDRKAKKETVKTICCQLEPDIIIGNPAMLKMHQNANTDSVSYDELMQRKICKTEGTEYNKETDIYDILFTTGTTGQSKGVMTTRGSVIAAINNEIEGSGMKPDEVLLVPIPLNHSFGIGKMRATLYLGATVALLNSAGMVTQIKESIAVNHCTAMICVPSALQIMLRQSENCISEVLGTLRFIEAASAPFETDLKENLMRELPDVHILNRYGSTETPAAVYLDLKERPDKIASIGRALSTVQIKVVGDHREELTGEGIIGELAIKGPMVMSGYYQEDKLTQSVLTNGWMYSSDLAYIDEEGYIFLQGRADDVINSGGKKFSPFEIEELLLRSGMIKECALAAVKDPNGILGNVPVMAYVPEDDSIQEKQIAEYLRERIEKYKLPTAYKRLELLPRNYMGKLDRKNIKSLFEVGEK